MSPASRAAAEILGAGRSAGAPIERDAIDVERDRLGQRRLDGPGGEEIREYGPFVMNTKEQLVEAVRDYQAGRVGEIAR